ncbi:2-aminoethylphosphonate ABC transporter permease subunit, partial [Burkholderia pseudomallei]|nr:2-aminoethylphosphonate ABC transporter permease subunit [Burkholderia pseudomallei]
MSSLSHLEPRAALAADPAAAARIRASAAAHDAA